MDGTVQIQKGAITDTVNIRRVTPYKNSQVISHGGECNAPLHSEVRRSQRLQTLTDSGR